jgi:hypothetical protein
MTRILKVETLQAIGEDIRIPPKGWHEQPRIFSFARRNCRLCNGGSHFLGSTRSQAQLSNRIPPWAAQTKLRDAMPRAILDMNLGGSGSELDGLGHVGGSSFLARVGQLLRQWRVFDVWGRCEASSTSACRSVLEEH